MGVDIVEMNHIRAEIAQKPPHRTHGAVVAEHAARGPEATGKRAAEVDRRRPVAAPGRRQALRMGACQHRNLMAAGGKKPLQRQGVNAIAPAPVIEFIDYQHALFFHRSGYEPFQQ